MTKKEEFEQKFVWTCTDDLCEGFGERNLEAEPDELWQWIEEQIKEARINEIEDYIKNTSFVRLAKRLKELKKE